MAGVVAELRRNFGTKWGSTVAVLLTLALGIGAATAIFTVIKGVLINGIPLGDPQRVLLVLESNPEAGYPIFTLSALNFRDFEQRSRSFEQLAAYRRRSTILAPSGSPPRRIQGADVTHNYLEAYSVRPATGRDFEPEDDAPGAPRVAILNHSLWMTEFGGRQDILEQTIRLDGEVHTIIGVLPPGLQILPEVIVPLAIDYESSDRGYHFLTGSGLLAAGKTHDQALAELRSIAAALEQEHPISNKGWTAQILNLQQYLFRNIRPALLLLQAAVAGVLLIGCFNVAQLLLTRTLQRERELAIRMALGASRWRVAGTLLRESLVLAAGGGLLGLMLAWLLVPLVTSLSSERMLHQLPIEVDGGVLLFGLLITLGAGVLCGLLPLTQIRRIDLQSALKEGDRSSSGSLRGSRIRKGLVAVEAALALILLIGSGVLLRSFVGLLQTETGFEVEDALTARLDLPESAYADDGRKRTFYRRLLEAAEAIPGVRHVGLTDSLPLSGEGSRAYSFTIRGRPVPEQLDIIATRWINPDYFKSMGIPLLQGRAIGAGDNKDGLPVAVVDQKAAQAYWPSQPAVGQWLNFEDEGSEPIWCQIVGVVGNVRHSDMVEEPQPTVYFPYLQRPLGSFTLIVKTTTAPGSLAPTLRSTVAELDPSLAIYGIRTLEEVVETSLAQPRFNLLFLALFAAVALLLAAIGVYGVTSYGVRQQQRSMGIRVALGAPPAVILRQVLLASLLPVLLGVGLGVVLSLGGANTLASLVAGISEQDPLVIAGAALLLIGIAALAALLPSLSVARIDPARVLREE